MVFSSLFFLYAFLPLAILSYYLLNPLLRNLWLVLLSLVFYAWSTGVYVSVLAISVTFNYLAALTLEPWRGRWPGRAILGVCLAANLSLLAYFKYLSWILGQLAPDLLSRLPMPQYFGAAPLLGVSFFTFHAISYIVDVHRGRTPAQRNFLLLTLYMVLFPQLLAGPLILYRDISEQLARRSASPEDVASGLKRFLRGLAKKVLIADVLAFPVDAVFNSPLQYSSFDLVAFAVGCFGLQMFFDFSGYSDMAIGLARMFGFHFPENFNYPYVSLSVQEFWQRWHISLSNWFRSYLFFPLAGGAQGADSLLKVVGVFVLVGFWHGPSWTFLLFGLWNGLWFSAELGWLGPKLAPQPVLLRRAYLLGILFVGLLFFRSPSLIHLLLLLRGLATLPGPVCGDLRQFLQPDLSCALMVALLLTTPSFLAWLDPYIQPTRRRSRQLWEGADVGYHLALLLLCTMRLAAASYRPFLYFAF